ncbi:hypothetical protein OUZ56_025390 [Daphnia magna]|uniref:Uncharacterized protein n=1 Tax=Daphnia magna TaxID=35525 RepID=A0ABQ9ZJQ7_9CRUS|nr:hypothetical protein OUZ56_025390 [Daphnia magna]
MYKFYYHVDNMTNLELNRQTDIHKSLDEVFIHHPNTDAKLIEMVKSNDENITWWKQIFFKEVIFFTYWNSLTKS